MRRVGSELVEGKPTVSQTSDQTKTKCGRVLESHQEFVDSSKCYRTEDGSRGPITWYCVGHEINSSRKTVRTSCSLRECRNKKVCPRKWNDGCVWFRTCVWCLLRIRVY